MYVLKNTTKGYEFNNIVEYEINEQPNLIAKKQFVNGKRKKITTSYTDVVIKFDLKGLDGSTAKTYLTNLVDGDVYQYWSIVDNKYNTAEFIVTLPPLPLEQCLASDNSIVDKFTIILEKSDDAAVSV